MSEAPRSPAELSRFSTPIDSLGALDPETAATLISASADVTLVVDERGIVLDVAFGSADLAKDAYRDWIGRRWTETVTIESRPKIEELIREAAPYAASRWRQINYPGLTGPDVPVRYSVVRCGKKGRIVALGKDLRAMAVLQQRLADAQQAMEREYARIRGAEKRYRLLFQLASEAVLIVDAANQRIMEANPAACALLDSDVKKLLGRGLLELFDQSGKQAAQSFAGALQVAPRVDNVHVTLAETKEAVLLSGSMFRQENASHFIVLLTRLIAGAAPLPREKDSLLRVVEKMPDAFVVTDLERRILTANSAFLDLIQATSEAQVRGESIETWIGRPGIDVDVLFGNLRTHGSVRHFSTILRSQYGSTEDIEITAVAAPDGAQPCLGFAIRTSGWRSGREKLGGRELPRTIEQFTELVGRVPLKNLVRETTDLIERLCIEAALELTHDNRASAADMLGLSRQGFYTKLRRYGLGDLGDDGGGDAGG